MMSELSFLVCSDGILSHRYVEAIRREDSA
jgi:hypothetical protein